MIEQSIDPRKKLYEGLSQSVDLGTFDEFNSKMNNPESRKKLYNAVSSKFDLGTFDEFERKVGGKQTPPAGGSPSKSSNGGSQSPSTPKKFRMMTEDELEADKKANPQNYKGSNQIYVNRGIDPRTTYRSGKPKSLEVQEAEDIANIVGIPQDRHLEAQSEMMSDFKGNGQKDIYLQDIDHRVSTSKTSGEEEFDNDANYEQYRNKGFYELNASKLFKEEELKDIIDVGDFRDYLVRSGWADKIDSEEAAYGHIDDIREGTDTQSQGYKYKILSDYLIEKRNTLMRDKAILDTRVKTNMGTKEDAARVNNQIIGINKQLISQISKFDALKERQDKLQQKEYEWRDYLRGDSIDIGKELEYYGSRAWNGVSKIILNTVGSTLDMIGDVKSTENSLRGNPETFTSYHNAAQATDDIFDMISVDMPDIQPSVLDAKEVNYNGDTYQVSRGTIYKDGVKMLDDEISGEDYKAILAKSRDVNTTSPTVSGRGLAAGAIDVIGQLYIMTKTAKALPIKNYTAAAGLAGALQTHHDTYTQVKRTLEDAVAQGELKLSRKDVDKFATLNAYMNDMVVASTGMLSPNKPLANLNKDAIIQGIKNLYSKEAGTLGRQQMATFFKTMMTESLKEVAQEESEYVLQKQTNAITNMMVNKDVLDTEIRKDELMETALVTFLGTGAATGGSNLRSTFGSFDSYNIKKFLASRDSGDTAAAIDKAVKEGDITQEFATKINEQIFDIRKYDSKIPDNVENGKRERILPLLKQKSQLEAEAKTKDSAFKESYKAKIEQVDAKINEIVNEKARPNTEATQGETTSEESRNSEGETIRPQEVTNEQEGQRQTEPAEAGVNPETEAGRAEEGTNSSNDGLVQESDTGGAEQVTPDDSYSIEEDLDMTAAPESTQGQYNTMVLDASRSFRAAPDKKTAMQVLRSKIDEAVRKGTMRNRVAASLIKAASNIDPNNQKQVDKFIQRLSKAMLFSDTAVKRVAAAKKSIKRRIKKEFNRSNVVPTLLSRIKTENIPVQHLDEYSDVMNDLANSKTPDFRRASDLWEQLQPALDAQEDERIAEKEKGKESKEQDVTEEWEILDDLLSNVTGNPDDFLPYEKDIVSKFNQIRWSPEGMKWMKENLSKRDLRRLIKAMGNLDQGVLLNKTLNDITEKYKVYTAVKAIESSKTKSIYYVKGFRDNILKALKIKAKSTDREGFFKALNNTMLHNVDMVVKGLKGTPIYTNIIHPITAAQNKADIAVEKVYSKYMNLIQKARISREGNRLQRLGKSIKQGLSIGTENYFYDFDIVRGLYYRQLEYNAEGNKIYRENKIRKVSDHIQAMLDDKSTDLTPDEVARIKSIYDKFADSDGNIDVKKIEEYFTPEEQEVVDFEKEQIQEGLNRSREVNDHRKGESLIYFDDYFPRRNRGESHLDESDVTPRMLGTTSVRADASNLRKSNKALPLDLRTSTVFMQHVRENLIEYNLSDVVKRSGAILNALKKNANGTEDVGMAKFSKAMTDAIKVQVKARMGGFNNQYTKNSKGYELWRATVKGTFTRVLIDLKRLAVDVVTQWVPVAVYNADRIPAIIKANKALSFDFLNTKLFNDFGSTQAERIEGRHAVDYSSGITTTISKAKFNKLSPSRFENFVDFYKKNKLRDLGDLFSKKQYELSDGISNYIWKQDFLQNFKALSGEDFSPSSYEENKDYKSIHEKSIREAISKADRSASLVFNTGTSAEQKIKIQADKTATQRILNFMSSFKFNESAVMKDSFMSLLGAGTLDKKEALRTALIVNTRGVAYTFLQATALSYLLKAMGMGGDDDDEDTSMEEKEAKKAFAAHAMLAFLGNQNNAVGLLGATLVELVNQKIIEDSGEEYDPYADSLVFAPNASQSKEQTIGMFGAEGAAIQALYRGTFKQAEIYDKIMENEEVTPEDIAKTKYIQYSLDFIAQITGLPLSGTGKFAQKVYNDNNSN